MEEDLPSDPLKDWEERPWLPVIALNLFDPVPEGLLRLLRLLSTIDAAPLLASGESKRLRSLTLLLSSKALPLTLLRWSTIANLRVRGTNTWLLTTLTDLCRT